MAALVPTRHFWRVISTLEMRVYLFTCLPVNGLVGSCACGG